MGIGIPPRTVYDLLSHQVSLRPGHPAVEDHRGRRVTYGELWAEAGRLAGALVGAGVGRGDPVAIAVDRSVEMVVAMVGVLRLGAYYVLLDPYSPPARNEAVVRECGARVLVEAADQPEWGVIDAAHRVSLPLPEDSVPADVPPVDRDPEDVLYVAYTSGSTGRPKGAIAPDRAVANFVTEGDLLPLSSEDRVASLCNPVSDATTLEVLKPLVSGATVVVLPAAVEMDIPDWHRVLREHRITAMFLMAGLVEQLAEADPTVFAPLDVLVFGGEALNPETALRISAAAPPRRLVLGYGPTEVTVFATYFDCTTESVSRRDRIPLGTPLRGYTLSVVDDQLRPVPPGEPGELCVGGPGVAKGYLGRPEMTAQRFVHLPDDVVYRTGDIVRVLADGVLEFVGRVDRQVKIRGFRIEPEEVERALLATGLARTAAVVKSDTRPAHLLCFYVPAAGVEGPDTSVRLAAALAERLPGYMIPARWVPVPELPLTGMGKVDRARLLTGLSGKDEHGVA